MLCEVLILETAVANPDMSHAEIAAETGSSESYVRDIRNKYEDRLEVQEESSTSPLVPLLLILFGTVLLAYWIGII